VGLIGKNGSGKTTLLRIIANITKPTTGKALTNGKVVSLIELTAGFHPDMNGLDNIYLNGMLLGMDKAEINTKIKDIITFADIGDFIYQPFYTYSSGMALRLGISVALAVNPQILILDEYISAGDEAFQRKLSAKMNSLPESSTLIFVSHNQKTIREFCKTTILLSEGKIEKVGTVDQVLKSYLQS
jgi:teichoic acid transport system ATP-binding protein